MIYLIAGRPRSGKTYEAVKYHIIPALEEGRKVITNIPLNLTHIAKLHGKPVADLAKVVDFDYSDFESGAAVFPFSRPSHYQDDWRDENGRAALYVIDEAHFAIPKGGTFPDVKKFYTMHGHYGIDMVLMTQNPRQIDSDILNLVEIVYRTIKQVAMGSSKTYVKKVQDGWRGDVVNTTVRKYDKKIFPYYKSHTQSAGAVIEAEAKDIIPFWRRWPVIGFGVCLVLATIILSNTKNPLSAAEVPDIEPPVTSLPVPAPQQAQQVQQYSPPQQQRPVNRQQEMPSRVPNFPFSHPFHTVDLHIQGSYSTRPDQSDFTHVFSASRNGQALFTIRTADLIRAGYEVFSLGDCSVFIQWHQYQKFLTCDSPTVAIIKMTE